MNEKVKQLIPDSVFLRIKYKRKMGKTLHLRNPRTFNEKLQWLKLHDHNPKYLKMVDKYEAKNYVEDKIGEQYIIQTYGVWEKFENIDFDVLPNQFVLKCTHDSGGIVLCKDKNNLNIVQAKNKIDYHMKKNYFWFSREWPYKNIKPKIIAEKYLSDDAEPDGLKDYKIWCFNGKPQLTLVCSDRFSKEGLCEDFYDLNWNHLSIKRPKSSNSLKPVDQPKNYSLMLNLAEVLSQNIPFIRVDFYEINEKVYFGELTFYPAEGMEAFIPEEWDYKLGDMLAL